MAKFEEYDVFGNPIEADAILRDDFIEPPFSVLDTKSGSWRDRANLWKTLGIKSEIGRDAKCMPKIKFLCDRGETKKGNMNNGISIFDPALCEVLYKWFCPDGGKILDPFAGGSVRGIVANYLGFKYTGIDIRPEQVESNREQAAEICKRGTMPEWICGDSDKELENVQSEFDFVFSCPPYADLEVYSELEGDISNMPYPEFLQAYKSIIKKACAKLKPGALACFVVGEVRDKNGNYIGFVPDTIRAFVDAGMVYQEEIILLNCISTAALRARKSMESKKLTKTHQNVLIFRK